MELYTNIKFDNNNKLYTFSTDDETLCKGMYVIVESQKGLELAKVVTSIRKTHNLAQDAIIKPIVRIADESDLKKFELNKNEARVAKMYSQLKADELKLAMRIIYADYTLDKYKLTLTYTSEERVDFRDLLKILAQHFKCRIELKQIGSRDKAKLIGGIGICGRELCCKNYISDFDMISINMAKNQMLALNISKLSGACGKLKCCLKYEDETYTEIKMILPKVNSLLEYEGEIYKLSNINIIARVVKLENTDRVLFLTLDDVLSKATFKHESKKVIKNA